MKLRSGGTLSSSPASPHRPSQRGTASALAEDGSMITLTGSGTFKQEEDGGVTGGGSWVTHVAPSKPASDSRSSASATPTEAEGARSFLQLCENSTHGFRGHHGIKGLCRLLHAGGRRLHAVSLQQRGLATAV